MQTGDLRCFSQQSLLLPRLVPSVTCLFLSFFSSSDCLSVCLTVCCCFVLIFFSYEPCFVSSVKMYLFYNSVIMRCY